MEGTGYETRLFNADIESLERALKMVGDFGRKCWSVPKCKKNEGALVGEMEK